MNSLVYASWVSNGHGFDDKLARANHHLRWIKRSIERWLATSVEVCHQLEFGGDTVVTAEPLSPVPEQLRVVVGDYLCNLRACLDQLAFALAEANCRGALPDTVARNSQFPIIGQASSESKKSMERRVAGIQAPAERIIEKLQPYHLGKDFRDHPLWKLNELANIDKHRTPHVALVAHQVTQLPIPFLKYSAEFLKGGAIRGKTEIVRYRARGKVRFDLVFEHPVQFRGHSVLGTLMPMYKYVNESVLLPLRSILQQRAASSGQSPRAPRRPTFLRGSTSAKKQKD